MKIRCDRCSSKIKKPGGGLVFGAPSYDNYVEKLHLCVDCMVGLYQYIEEHPIEYYKEEAAEQEETATETDTEVDDHGGGEPTDEVEEEPLTWESYGRSGLTTKELQTQAINVYNAIIEALFKKTNQ